MQFLWKGSQGSDCLKLLGRGFGGKDSHSYCFSGKSPKTKQNNNKELNRNLQFIQKENLPPISRLELLKGILS